VNELRRLRQHNGEISGGARATSRQSRRPWKKAIVVRGFGTKTRALSFEKTWKLVSKQAGWRCDCATNCNLSRPICRRLRCLTRAFECYERRHGSANRDTLSIHVASDIARAHGGTDRVSQRCHNARVEIMQDPTQV